MQLLLSGLALTTLLAVPVAPLAISSTEPVAFRDISGNYVIAFDGNGTRTLDDLTLTQSNGGALSGFGGFPASGPYTYNLTVLDGNITGNTVNITVVYSTEKSNTRMHLYGIISSDGSLAGEWSDTLEGGRTGTWKSTASQTLLETESSNK